jgi:hypothetical protein
MAGENVGDAEAGASKIDGVDAGTSTGAMAVAGGTPSTAEEFTRETLAAKEMAENPQETYADLKARATKAEEKLKELQSVSGEAPGRWRRRRWESDAAATASVNAIPEMPSSSTGVMPSSGVLSNALTPGGSGTASSELAAVAVQTAPLTIQLLIPLLMLLVLFGFFSLIAYALDFTGRRGGPPGGGSGGRAGHRRMPSGDAPLTEVDAARLSDWSPRRGFAYSSSWNTKLNEAPSSATRGGASGSFALPASYMPGDSCGFSPELEQRRGSPGRSIEERRASAVGLHVV